MTVKFPEARDEAKPKHEAKASRKPISLRDVDVIARGEAAIDHLNQGYSYWLDVGMAIEVGRAEAMKSSGASKPEGRGFCRDFGLWLDKFSKFRKLNSATRSHLHEIITNRDAIERWRSTLTEGERLRLNFPETVLRRWKKATQVPSKRKPRSYRQAVVELEEENLTLRRSGDRLLRSFDEPEEIAAALDLRLPGLTLARAEKVCGCWLALIRKRNDDETESSETRH
jgi:hypothetical protein